MLAPFYVNSTVASTAAAATSVVTPVPSGSQAGDLLLWFWAGRAASIATPTTPANWSVFAAVNKPTTATMFVIYSKLALSAEAATYNTGALTSGSYSTAMFVIKNVDMVTPADVAIATSTSTTSFAPPAIITPAAGGPALLMMFAGSGIGATSATPVYSSNNADAQIAQTQGTVASVQNAAMVTFYKNCDSGAFTFNLTSSAGTFNAGATFVAALRPSRGRVVGSWR